MIFHSSENNIPQKLKQHEIDELIEYCKEHGFSEEQTEIFVRNSVARLFSENEE